MSLNKKFNACSITVLLLISTFSFFIILPENVNAQDKSSKTIDEFDLFNPFITYAFYQYFGEEDLEISGDIVFDLYFYLPLLSQLKLTDDVAVSIYKPVGDDQLFYKLIENCYASITLESDLLEEQTQKYQIKLKDVNFSLDVEDSLLFIIEIKPTDKPIGNIIEKRYEKKFKSRVERLGKILNESSNEDLNKIGDIVKEFLNITDEFGLGAEDVARVANSFRSSSFVYNSESHPSSITLPVESGDDITLYYHNMGEGFNELNNETPNGTESTWPPLLINYDTSPPSINTDDWMVWFALWTYYIMMQGDGEEEPDENEVTYYLTSENKLVSSKPDSDKSIVKLSGDPVKWSASENGINKIIQDANAELYVYFPKILTLSNIKVNATLKDGNTTIDSDEQELNRTTVAEILQGGPNEPLFFEFDTDDYELFHNHKLNLEVSVSNVPKFTLKSTKLVCDSTDYPSNLFIKYADTDNINLLFDSADSIPVVPGDSAEFILNISSKYSDTVSIEIIPDESDDESKWEFDYSKSVNIEKDDYELITITVTSLDNTTAAELDKIDFEVLVTGKTGIDDIDAEVYVSEEAVEYNFDAKINPMEQDVEKGKNATYKITIKNLNTGIWDDSYDISINSEHDWNINYLYTSSDLTNIDVGEETTIEISIKVPQYTDITSDKLSFNITSSLSKYYKKEESKTIEVTTTVLTTNIFEQLYDFFESVANDLGLGENGAEILISLLILIILLIIIVIILLKRKQPLELICVDRIKDIIPDEEARYEITIKNPTKISKSYEISKKIETKSEGFDVSLSEKEVFLESKESKVIILLVKPNDYIKTDEWAEVKVIVKPIGKNKTSEISTLTSIKDAKVEVNVRSVFHWPRIFKKGDRVETSFKLVNTGNVSANNVTAILYVNGEEKSKVEDITIPRGGYADIEMPWIAVKGKNEVNIVVK